MGRFCWESCQRPINRLRPGFPAAFGFKDTSRTLGDVSYFLFFCSHVTCIKDIYIHIYSRAIYMLCIQDISCIIRVSCVRDFPVSVWLFAS